jgi:hypothetical protein
MIADQMILRVVGEAVAAATQAGNTLDSHCVSSFPAPHDFQIRPV